MARARPIISSRGHDDLLVDEGEDVKGRGSADDQIRIRVIVWLLGSIDPPIREQAKTMTTAKQVRSSLEIQFTSKSNMMQATRVMYNYK